MKRVYKNGEGRVEEIKPVFNRIIVKRYEKKYEYNNTEGKRIELVIPDSVRKTELKMSQGEVISVGEQVKELKPGTKIMFGKYAGFDLKSKEGQYAMMNDDDVLGILEGGYIDE
jgi:chaperonin GroES|tara:strand:+ start:418 stop:759 length:342 start_codon:yes stop_codon:yes gene_type:complete